MTAIRLKTIVQWVLISNGFAALIGVLTLPWRDQIVTALSTAGVPQPTPVETVVLFVLTVGLFYLWAEMIDSEVMRG